MKTLHLAMILVSIVITCTTVITINNEAHAQSYGSLTNSSNNKTIAILQWSDPLTGQARSVVMSDDGNYVVTGTQNGKTEGHVYLYDHAGNNLWDYKADRNIVSVSISKSGQYLAAGGYQLLDNGGNGYGFNQWYANPAVYFFDNTGTMLWKHEVSGSKTLWSVTMSADGSQVITNLDGNIVSYDRQGNLLWNYTLGNNIGSISISNDGSHIVTNTADHVLYLDDEGNVVWSYVIDRDENARSLISPDGKYVLASSTKTSDSYGTTYLFDNKGNLLWTGIIKGLLDSAAISSDDSYILMSSDWFTQLYDLKGHMIWNYTSSANSVKISSNNLRMAATETIGGERNVVLLDNHANKKWEFPSDSLDLSSIAMSKDGSALSFARSAPDSGVSTLYYFQIPNDTFQMGSNMLSPIQQFKSGVSISDIVCKEGLYFVVKSHDQDPMCLKAGTISKLASRGFLYGTSASNANYTTIIIPPGSENQASHNTYSPNNATVVIGINNTVQWINQADTANTIVSDVPTIQDGKPFDSNGVIKPEQSYVLRFTEPGTFSYHTEPHPWMKGTIVVLPQSNQITSTKTSDPFGITALIIYHPPDLCLNLIPPSNNMTVHGCPPNTFYLKINSATIAYLMGYNICDGESCTKTNDVSVLLPIKNALTPNFQMIGLPVDLKWKYGDTVEIQLYVSPTNNNKTASLVDLGNSSIVP